MKLKPLMVTGIMFPAVLYMCAYAQHASNPAPKSGSAAPRTDQQQTAATIQDKISALEELRDSGVITDQEYETKVSAVRNGSPAPANPAKGPKISWTGTRTEEAADSRYGITAMTMQVPVGWKYAGEIGVSGKGTCHAGQESLHVTEESPDGSYQIIQLPGVHWAASNNPRNEENMARHGCPAVQITTAAGFMANILVPQLHPNGRIIRVDPPPPGLVQAMWQKLETERNYNQMLASALGQPTAQYKVDGAEMRVQYEVNGQAMEEKLGGFVLCSNMPFPDSSIRRDCSSSGIVIIRAPLGRLDEFLVMPQFKEVMARQVNPQWTQRVQEQVRQDTEAGIQKIKQSEAMSRAMINASWANFNAMQTSNQMFYNTLADNNRQFNANMAAQTAASIQQSRDLQNRMDEEAHRFTLFAGDKMENVNPYNGQTVVTSNRYSRQWISSDGSTWVGTNNNENPNDYVGPGGPTFAPLTPK